MQELPWDVAGAIKQPVPAHDGRETFYARHGDLIPLAAIAFTILLALWNIFAIVTGRRHGKKTYSSR